VLNYALDIENYDLKIGIQSARTKRRKIEIIWSNFNFQFAIFNLQCVV